MVPCCGLLDLHPCRTFNCFSPLEDCTEASGTVRDSVRDREEVSSSLGPSPVSKCGVFSHRILSSRSVL